MSMNYTLLGRTGLRVSELCLGTMTFGEAWGWGADATAATAQAEAFAEAGGNFIDTAELYTNGESERITGEIVGADRDHWVLATKYGLNVRAEDPNAGGAHRKNLTRALEQSLRRLGTDHIDLYWLHAWDAFTPVEESLRALDDAVRAGKILYVGISNTPAWIVSQANVLADLRGWSPFVALQIPYSLVERTVERDLLPMARAGGMTVTAWAPLAGGLLSGRYGTDREHPTDTRMATLPDYNDTLTDRNLVIADAVNTVAAELGVSAAQVAIAWTRARDPRGIVPIVGARRPEQLEDNLGALDVVLDEDQLARLDAASAIEMGFPHDFPGRLTPYGDTLGRIDAAPRAGSVE